MICAILTAVLDERLPLALRRLAVTGSQPELDREGRHPDDRPRKAAQPTPSTTSRAPVCSRVLIPAKKSAIAKRTTQSVYRSARSTLACDSRGRDVGLRLERIRLGQSPPTGTAGIANGVSGAFGFVSGFVAIQASTAGRNSGRKRRK